MCWEICVQTAATFREQACKSRVIFIWGKGANTCVHQNVHGSGCLMPKLAARLVHLFLFFSSLFFFCFRFLSLHCPRIQPLSFSFAGCEPLIGFSNHEAACLVILQSRFNFFFSCLQFRDSQESLIFFQTVFLFLLFWGGGGLPMCIIMASVWFSSWLLLRKTEFLFMHNFRNIDHGTGSF